MLASLCIYLHFDQPLGLCKDKSLKCWNAQLYAKVPGLIGEISPHISSIS